MASSYGKIYIIIYMYSMGLYATIITLIYTSIMFNTSSYTTIVTLNLYVNTLFLLMAAFRKVWLRKLFHRCL